MCTHLANRLTSKSQIFDPVKRLQLHGLKTKIPVVYITVGMKSLSKIVGFHAKNYFLMMKKKKKMCKLLCGSIMYTLSYIPQYEQIKGQYLGYKGKTESKEIIVICFGSFKELV